MDKFTFNPRIKMLWEMLNASGCDMEGSIAPVPRASLWSNDQGESKEGFYLLRSTREDFTEKELRSIERIADALGFSFRGYTDFEIEDERYRMPSLTFDL